MAGSGRAKERFPGGLCSAQCLRRRGVNVTAHERDDDLHPLTSPEPHALALDMTKDWHPRLRTSVPIPAWPTNRVTPTT